MSVQSCINQLISTLHFEHAIISPGSRNAPIAYALANSNARCHSVVDERSAAFVALGIAKKTRHPVLLTCTSGTAAANYYPAIIEAFYARVPLIIITADRPPEQIDAWDGQAIRQKNLFANHIRAEFQTPDNYESTELFEAIANRLNACWENEITGPIHINVPIREPFYNFSGETPITIAELPEWQEDIVSVSLPSIAHHLNQSFVNKKVLVFNGMEDGENIVVQATDDSVMLSDITSNQSSDVHYWDALLFVAQTQPNGIEALKVFQPDVLVTTGTTTVSKGLKRFLQFYPPQLHIHLSRTQEAGKMFKTEIQIIDPNDIVAVLVPENDNDGLRSGPYVEAWLNLARDFEARFAALTWAGYNEFSAMNYCLNNLPGNATIHFGNSMPVRYASFLLNSDVSSNTIYANRGTSGIDGCVSTALGNALATNDPVYLFIGDVAFFYDVNALYTNELPENLKIVILNNQGGGIFELIAGPDKMGDAIDYQTTNHTRNAEHLAKHFNAGYKKAYSLNDVSYGMEFLLKSKACSILEIITDREANTAFFKTFTHLFQ
jgi:2-succinyl-5-enolpyruvyl-6-hydroxy-3-cyclohexene-1-carboxylate synthase